MRGKQRIGGGATVHQSKNGKSGARIFLSFREHAAFIENRGLFAMPLQFRERVCLGVGKKKSNKKTVARTHTVVTLNAFFFSENTGIGSVCLVAAKLL